jgi:hypothetical protein
MGVYLIPPLKIKKKKEKKPFAIENFFVFTRGRDNYLYVLHRRAHQDQTPEPVLF